MLLGYENVEQYRGGLGEWKAEGRYLVVETPEVAEKLLGWGAIAVDVRDAAAFELGRLPDARSVPLARLLGDPVAALPGVDADATIMVYAAGGGDPESLQAARALKEAGFRAVRRYQGGVAEWLSSGRPVE